MESNTKLWDSVCKTDPAHTKSFSRAGGFKGTAIKPFWLMRRATEVFGPCGISWGWEELENKMVSGVWCSKVRLWYRVPKEFGEHPKTEGQIEQWGQTVMEGTNKNGAFVDEEAPKKAVTDAVTKCLSYLGFAGDVHMGLFDDSKYVEEAKAEFSPGAFKNASLRKTFCENILSAFDKAHNQQALDDARALYLPEIDAMKASGNEHDELAVQEIRKQYALAVKRFKNPVPDEPVDEFMDGGRQGIQY